MRRLPILAFSLFALFALSACASGSGTAAPAATAPQPAASEPAASAPAAGGGCTASSEAGAVSVGIENFAFAPADVSAAVGETITWTNSDSAAHTATLDDGACDTGNIAQNASAGLVFDAAGTYPYHCTIHPNMKGTITIQ
ncbi:MAG TPA: cupredoxin family copper-binding protein [Candidatus Limnocylindrales bacterium]|nr:cupredoxin family copper-binding protein [Candidatus Limnocylindrales bacterium]